MYGPLESGADNASWEKMNKEPFLSGDHGGRFVDVYVNAIGAEAFKHDDKPFPVGSIIVKASWEAADGGPSTTPGPLFVMEKRPAGY